MADYDEEIPFGVGVSARGVDPDTENPFDTGAVNPGYDETGEMNEMDRFPSSSSRRVLRRHNLSQNSRGNIFY